MSQLDLEGELIRQKNFAGKQGHIGYDKTGKVVHSLYPATDVRSSIVTPRQAAAEDPRVKAAVPIIGPTGRPDVEYVEARASLPIEEQKKIFESEAFQAAGLPLGLATSVLLTLPDLVSIPYQVAEGIITAEEGKILENILTQLGDVPSAQVGAKLQEIGRDLGFSEEQMSAFGEGYLGGELSSIIVNAVPGAKQLVKGATWLKDKAVDYIGGASARVADRGTTLTSGVDPMAALDEIIVGIQQATETRKRNKLVKFIQDNPDGFTLDLGGAPVPAQGFVVAPLKETEIFVDSQDLSPETLDALVDNVIALTQASGGKVYAGGWFDEETGRYVLDAVQVVDDREQALYLAAAGKQDAIFDLGEINVIRTTDGLQELRQGEAFDLGRFNEQRANQEQLAEGFGAARVSPETPATTADEVAAPQIPDMPEQLTPAIQAKESNQVVTPATGSKVLVDDAGKFLVDQTIQRHGRKLDPINNTEDLDVIINDGVTEASYQLNQPISGANWYDDDVAEAFVQTSKVIPELAVDEGLRVVMTAMAAVTSPGTRAAQNWKNASAVMEEFLNTGKISGRNPANGKYFGGTRGPIIEKQLKLLEYLLTTKGVQGTADWLLGEHTVKELTALRQESGLYSAANKVAGKADDVKLGPFVFGEKVGPFMLNLNGKKETTADIWFSRTYNRLTGQLFDTPTGEMIGAPRNMAERDIMKQWNRAIADKLGRDEQSIQAVLWYLEQQLYYSIGVKSARSEAFSDGAKSFIKDKGISDSVRNSDASQAGREPQGSQAAGQATVRGEQ